jgi:polygalacturonase
VDNVDYWNEDGVDIVDCENVRVTNCYIDAADDGICLKSHDATKACKNIFIGNNKIRTSANGIKFGTASKGGFENIRIINNIVFDTYRSAIALEAVDGGYIENVEIDSLQSINTGNIIFLRTGERIAGKKAAWKISGSVMLPAMFPSKNPTLATVMKAPKKISQGTFPRLSS